MCQLSLISKSIFHFPSFDTGAVPCKHFSFLKWHNVKCCQQMALENSAGKIGFGPERFSLTAPVAHTIRWCMRYPVVPPPHQWVLLNDASPWATSSGTSEGSSPANSMKQHFPMGSFASTQKVVSWQFCLAIFPRELYHLMGHGHGHTPSFHWRRGVPSKSFKFNNWQHKYKLVSEKSWYNNVGNLSHYLKKIGSHNFSLSRHYFNFFKNFPGWPGGSGG